MRRKILTVAVFSAVFVMAVPAAHADTASDEAAFVARINALRASVHVAPLRVDAEMTSIARRWAQQMAKDGNISHQPNLRQWVTQSWRKLGENVGVGFSVAGLHEAFVTSPHHYDNLVDPAFDSVGIGIVMSGGLMWVAEEFKMSGASAPKPKPAAAPATTVAPRPAPRPSPPTTRRPAPVTTTSTTVAPRPVAPPPPPPPPPEPTRLRLALELQRVLDATLRSAH